MMPLTKERTEGGDKDWGIVDQILRQVCPGPFVVPEILRFL